MRLGGEEQSEVVMRFHRQYFFLQNADKTYNQMQIFKTEPFTIFCSLFEQLQGVVILITSH